MDLNRNFAYKWGESDDPDSGIFDVCQRAFAGDKPFSERESTALAKFMYNNRKQIKVYATLQNYGQTVLMPYASKTTPAKDSREHILAANVATRAMHKVHGEQYDVGTFAESLCKERRIIYLFEFFRSFLESWEFLWQFMKIYEFFYEFYEKIFEIFSKFYEILWIFNEIFYEFFMNFFWNFMNFLYY